MKRVFMEHLALIMVAIVWAALVIGCASEPISKTGEAEVAAPECSHLLRKVASEPTGR